MQKPGALVGYIAAETTAFRVSEIVLDWLTNQCSSSYLAQLAERFPPMPRLRAGLIGVSAAASTTRWVALCLSCSPLQMPRATLTSTETIQQITSPEIKDQNYRINPRKSQPFRKKTVSISWKGRDERTGTSLRFPCVTFGAACWISSEALVPGGVRRPNDGGGL